MNNTEHISLINTENLVNLPFNQVVSEIKNLVKEGHIDPAFTATTFKKVADIHAELNKDKEIKEIFNDALSKYADDKTNPVLLGYKLSKRATGTRYDFSDCNHPVYNALCEIEKVIKDYKKIIEEELKGIMPKDNQISFGIKSNSIIVEEMPKLDWEPSGEEVPLTPPVKYSSESIIFTKQK